MSEIRITKFRGGPAPTAGRVPTEWNWSDHGALSFTGVSADLRGLPQEAGNTSYDGMNAKLAEIGTTLRHISSRMDEMAEQTREFRREAREDASRTRDELRGELKDLRVEVSGVADKLSDPETGLGVLKSRIEHKPGIGLVVVVAVGIVTAVSAVIVYADQLRALLP